uniref:Uncharacterized protein n=1 Tax=Acrobeloides nanus TaxID=290746 RepID=A0A914D6Q9_9BILA
VVNKRVSTLLKSGKFKQIPDNEDEIWLGLTADKGSDSVKLGFLIANRDGNINTIENLTLLALYDGDEKRKPVYAGFKSVAKEIDALSELIVDGKTYKIKK